MAKKWGEVAASDGFKALPPEQQDVARRQYFDEVVAPKVPQEHRESAWGEFSSFAGVGRRELPAGVTPSAAGSGRGTQGTAAAEPMRLDSFQDSAQLPASQTKTRAQKIAELDSVTDPMNPDYSPVTDNAVRALKTDAKGGMDAKRTRYPGRVLDSGIDPITATSAARDVASGALQIPGVFVKGVGDIARLATGDSVGKGLSDSAESVNQSIRENVGSRRAQQQARRFEQDMQDQALNAADVIVGNPGALADQILPTAGSMVLPVGTAAAAGKLAKAGRAAQMLDEAALAGRVANAREGAVLGTTLAQNAGDTFTNIRDDGNSVADAYTGAAITLPFTYAASRLTGGGAEGAVSNMLAGTAKGAVKAIPKAMAKEGGQELGEETGAYLGETIGKGQEFDLNTASKRGAVALTLGAVVGGGVEGIGAARAAREQRIKTLRDAGETAAADLLQQKHDKATAAEDVETELSRLPGNEDFANQYRTLRTSGVKPVEAASRSAIAITYTGILTDLGMSEKAITRALDTAKDMPLDKVPGFLHKFADILAKQGLVPPNETLTQIAPSLEAARDDAMDAAITAMSPASAMDDVLAMENANDQANIQEQTPADQAPASQTTEAQAADEAGTAAAGAKAGSGGLEADGVAKDETEKAKAPQGDGNTVLQNRNRATPSSIIQMQSISTNPDYGRLGFSRDFANGAPVVAGGQVTPERLGKTDIAVASDGRRIPVQYAVVEADDVLTSNRADGTPNVDYGNQSVQRIRAIAGNGRIAGLQQAHSRGAAEGYINELTDDNLHGVNPDVIRGMRAPVLVRVMPSDQVTDDIGDVSNTVGNLSLSAVEQANNDAQRVNLQALSFAEDGSITPETVRQFVRAMPQSEQGGLIDTNGQPAKQAVDRISAAVFARAYGNDQLIRLFAQAQDPEARNVLSALAQVAPKMARLEGMGALDIRDVVTQAAEIAVNARREGKALALAAQQLDMAADPMVGVVLDLFANNARTVKPVVEALSNAADFAYTEATKPAEDMFGAVPRASRADVINQLRSQDERASQENLENPAGRESVQVDAGRAEAEPAAAADAETAQASRPPEEAEQVAPAPPPTTPAPAGVSVSENSDGTVNVSGKEAVQKLKDAGVTKTMPTADGVVVGRSQSQLAKDALSERPEALIELRKRESVLKSLLECLG